MASQWDGMLREVSKELLLQETRAISRWVRLSGTPAELEAVRYVEDRLAGYGFATELLFHDAYISLPGAATLTVSGLGAVSCITHAFSPAGDYALFLADGMDPDADVTGKAVLRDGLAIGEEEELLRSRGAAALVMVNASFTHEMILHNIWGSPTSDQVDYLPKLPVISITAKDGARIREQLKLGPVAVQIHTEVDTGWRKIPLLVASLPGTVETDEFVLFSGHIDSWHYGAMDNGTANATMMEVGRVLAAHRGELRRGLKLAFWSGHSHGRYAGSTWYVDNHWHQLHEHCVCHVNVDSVGGMGATVLSEGMCMPETRALGAATVEAVAGVKYHGSRVNRSGDQSFTGVGLPSLFMSLSEQPVGAPTASTMWGPDTGGLGWWWHTTEDLPDKIDPEFLRRDASIYLAAVWSLVTEPVLPFDYSATAREFKADLLGRQTVAGTAFDLSPALAEADALIAAAEALQARLSALRNRASVAEPQVAAANQCLKRLGRLLIPVAYTQAGPYSHDLALAMPPLPCLAVESLAGLAPDSDQYKFVQPKLIRARNRVVHALVQAREEIANCMRQLEEA